MIYEIPCHFIEIIFKLSGRKGGTLVVCPASLLKQWEAEVKNHCKYGVLSVRVHHGPNRTTEARVLVSYDIVITTYQLIVRDHKTPNKGTFQVSYNFLSDTSSEK